MRKIKNQCAKKDFTEADLPKTRKQMFFDCYKEQFSLILRLGGLCLLFLFPLLAILLVRDMYLIGALKTLEGQTTEQIFEVYRSVNAVFGLAESVAFWLFTVLLSGISQILRQLLWGEPVFFFDDFKKGFLENAGRFAVIGFLLSAAGYFLGLLSGTALVYPMLAIFAFVFLPLGIWILLQTLYYRLGIGQVTKNAMYYLVRTFPVTVLLLVGTVLPFGIVLSFATLMAVKYAVLLLLSLFYVVPVLMVWILYALQTFDTYINKQYHTEIYRKGLGPILPEEQKDRTQ